MNDHCIGDNCSIDYGYAARLSFLTELMRKEPDTACSELLAFALECYPLSSPALRSHWLDIGTAFMAADRINREAGVYRAIDCGMGELEGDGPEAA
jgi:hypothetical protein